MSSSTDPRLGAIRLAWWRERLDELERIESPAEPRLQAVVGELLPRGISGEALSQLEDAWLPVLEPFPWGEGQANGLRLRGRLLFGIGARLLGADVEDGQAAGELWSLHDGASHCSDAQSRDFLVQEAALAASRLPLRVEPALRPLTILAALAAHSIAPVGRFGRGGAALKHRLTGRFGRRSA